MVKNSKKAYKKFKIVSELNKLYNEQVGDYKAGIIEETKEMITLKKEEVDSEILIP